jgi:preprotein translocase subunit YajC
VSYLPSISPEIDQFIQGSWPLILMAIIFYFILWRPQKKEQKKRSEFLSSLKKGDKIVTIGGVYGVIIRLGEKSATIQIAEKVEVEVARSAISNVQPPRGNNGSSEAK